MSDNEKKKPFYIIIFAAIAALIAFLLGRNSNRSGVRSDPTVVDGFGKSVDTAGELNSAASAGVDRSEQLTDSIRGNNQSAKDSIRTAKDILKRAKDRSDNKND